jgi:hypothetical protein
MSTIMQIFGHHTLGYENYHEGIKCIENALQVKILDRDEANKEKTNDPLQLNYYTQHEYFAKRYDENWGIWVFTNSALCDRFVVYKHFIGFSILVKVNLRERPWRKMVSGTLYHPDWVDNLEVYNEMVQDWNNVRSFIASITQKLGGNTILYFHEYTTGKVMEGNNIIKANNADGIVLAEELVWEGGDLTMIIEALSRVRPPTNYKELQGSHNEFAAENWFIEKL